MTIRQKLKRIFLLDYSGDMLTAHRALIDGRCTRAMQIGLVVYIFNVLEPWLDFHHVRDVVIQMTAEIVIACIFSLALTTWGRNKKLPLFIVGILVATAGFEAVVISEGAARSAYSDGFPVIFAFYSVFVPTSLLNSALVGIAIMLILASPELKALNFGGVASALLANATAFAILLCGRYIANVSWLREKVASYRQSAIVAAVSHDFRGALTSLRLLSDQLVAGKIPESDRLESYKMLAEESHRLSLQVEGLLDFGRLQSRYNFVTVDPGEEVQKIATDFNRNQASSGFDIRVDVSPETPLVRADRPALRSVINNLLENAVKYSPDCHTVLVIVQRQQNYAAIRIQDNGIGIPASELEVIFDPFVRGAHAKENQILGSGVGLAIVQNIVAAHEGKILVESAVGSGSAFTVLLPAVN